MPQTYALAAWPALLKDLGVRPANVLRRAGLPDDLIHRPSVRLTAAEYFRFWDSLVAEADDPRLPIRICTTIRAESFSPAIFAALCSPNLMTALQRLSQFKPLVAPVRLVVVEEEGLLKATFTMLDRSVRPPDALLLTELLFLVCLARIGAREPVRPSRATATIPPGSREALEEYLGCRVQAGEEHTLTFAGEDALRPFLTTNDAMWAVFEPELRKRLAELDVSATTAERVRACLLEALPSGRGSMGQVAKRLALSKRTLQRHLEREGATFQAVLRDTRTSLALHYLQRTDLPIVEISFLLGFEEPNSFYRAFSEWTGRTPEAARREAARREAALREVAPREAPRG